MSAERMTPILPNGQREERPLFVIMAVMSFLATLTLLLVLMGIRQSASWQNDLQSAATVQIMSPGDADRAVTILRGQPGIRSADLLSTVENRDLLAPWIGTAALPADLIIPKMVRLDVDRVEFDAARTNSAMEAANIESIVDDHQQWSANLSSTWARIRLALFSLLVIILMATVAISSFATQSVLQARQNIIQVLGQVGAEDGFIARLFLSRFLSIGFKAALTGMIVAVAFFALFMVFQNWGTDEYGMKVRIALTDLFWLLLLALVMGTISAVTAGLSAKRSIQGSGNHG